MFRGYCRPMFVCLRAPVRSHTAVRLVRQQTWCPSSERRGLHKHSAAPRPQGPPWRVLFFGSDSFALESLKLLAHNRSSDEKLVDTLEVVALSSDVPVRRFAQEEQLRVQAWPPEDVDGRFDVGVVVSFGCLLPGKLIQKFPYGILNVHPSLLPRWRGPAPILHTILRGDKMTGVTIIPICAKKFDVGPILSQRLHPVPEKCTSEELGATLATQGAHLLIDTLKSLCERIANKWEQSQSGVSFAPKIHKPLSWMVWEEQTCEQIDCLFRAIGSRMPLRTIWMGQTIKLLDFVGKCHISFSDERLRPLPGWVFFQKESNTLAVCCKDGWVGFKTVVLNQRLTAADFYNGYLHQGLKERRVMQTADCVFVSKSQGDKTHQKREKSATLR